LKIAQVLVGPPVLGQFHRRAQQLPAILLELLFQPFEQGEGIGGGPGKARNDIAALPDTAHLARVGLHHRVAHGNLTVARYDGLAALPDADDGGAVPLNKAVARFSIVHDARYGRKAAPLQASAGQTCQPPGPPPPGAPPAPTWPILPNRSCRKL